MVRRPVGQHEGDPMARFMPQHVDVRVPVVGLVLDDTPLTELDCLSCGESLTIHQPENGFPDRMLGTCESCHNWYLWDFHADGNHAVMVSLPDRGYFKDAIRAPAG
jgi:hypothetical protein